MYISMTYDNFKWLLSTPTGLFTILFSLVLFLVSCLPVPEEGEFDYVCPDGTPAEGKAATENTEKCSSCNDGDPPQNGICVNDPDGGEFSFICTNGMAAEGTTATENTEKCSSCNDGDPPQNGICVNDPDGGEFSFICTNGMPAGGTTAIKDTQKCASCDDGDPPQNGICTDNPGGGEFSFICTNGTPAGGTTPTENTQMCTDCDCGYTLMGDICNTTNMFTLCSSEAEGGFDPDGVLPIEFRVSDPDGAMNSFPKLTWGNPPDGTLSFVLIVANPGPGTREIHLALYNINANASGIPKITGMALTNLTDFGSLGGSAPMVGANTHGGTGWRGPLFRISVYTYFFKLYAVSEADLSEAMSGIDWNDVASINSFETDYGGDESCGPSDDSTNGKILACAEISATSTY